MRAQTPKRGLAWPIPGWGGGGSSPAAALTAGLLIAAALASFAIGVDAEVRAATDPSNRETAAPEWLARRGLLSVTPILWDNIGNPQAPSGSHETGPPAAFAGARSNIAPGGSGPRRTLLDDFIVPSGVHSWTITDFHWRHSWLVPDSDESRGTGVEIAFYADDPAANGPGEAGPGALVASLATHDYQEAPTGRTADVSGDTYHEMESSVNVAGPSLEPGRYWVEFAIAGPDSNFAWARAQLFEPMWLDYETLVGLEPGATVFGVDRDVMWALTGTAIASFERCNPDPTTLCIDDEPGDGRFEVRVAFETSQAGGRAGFGTPTPLASLGIARGGLMTFFSADNPEMLIKVLDGCVVNGNKWVFYAAGTNVALETTVTDTFTARQAVYTNADLHAGSPVQDTAAFPCDGSAGHVAVPVDSEFDFDHHFQSGSGPASACVADGTTLCIDDQPGDARWKVRVAYATTQAGGRQGFGAATALSQLGVNRGGLMTFFSADNPEMLIKVLDGCAITGHKWVFYSATTNVGLETTVTDSQTGNWVRYQNPDLNAAPPVQDTTAFACSSP